MRARNIKPGLFKDEKLADLPVEARYLFTGLWCLADCEGRLEDRPKMIKAEIYPYDESLTVSVVDRLIQLLTAAGFVQRYEMCGNRYIHVTNFTKHQHPHKQERESGSQLPEPPMVDVRQVETGIASCCNPIATGAKPEPLPVSTGATPDDCLNLKPETLNLITENLNMKTAAKAAGDLLNEIPIDKPPLVRPHIPAPKTRRGKRTSEEIRKALGARFAWWDEFWKIYPCHDGMNPAMDAFERRIQTREAFDSVIAGAKSYAAKMALDPERKFKYAQGWLNDERWNDSPTAPPKWVPRGLVLYGNGDDDDLYRR